MKNKFLIQVKEFLFYRILRLVFFINVLIVTQLSLNAQTNELKKNIKMTNVTIQDLVNKLGVDFKYSFFIIDEQVGKVVVSVDAKNATIYQILDLAFKDKAITYIVKEKSITITAKKKQQNENISKKITGLVTDEKGDPIIGATVKLLNINKGTVTDFDGKFNIEAPIDGKLSISYIGYNTLIQPIENRSKLNITLTQNSISLDEVVAIGYGSVRKKDLTGAVSSMGTSALKDIPITSAVQAMTGKMAGVNITKTEGSPDADIKIRIRGGGSITQDNSPLYIVDGFPVDNINDIAPTDIETIDILKDASSTAIYGARGANGVVLVTTKKGYEGKAKVNYNTYFGLKRIAKTLEVMNPYEYVYWQYEITTEPQNFERYFGNFNDFNLYKQMKGTNWQEKVFGRQGTSLSHNLSISGGGKNSKYNVSLTRNDEKEIMLGSDYNRTNFNIKTSNDIFKWLTVDLNARLSNTEVNGAGTSANYRLNNSVQYRPVNGMMDFVDYNLTTDNFEASNTYIFNPIEQAKDDYQKSKTQTYSFNGSTTIKLSKNLSYKLELGTQVLDNQLDRFYGLNTWTVVNYGLQPIATITTKQSNNYRMGNILNLNLRDFIPNHNLSTMLGEELNYSKTNSILVSSKYFPKYIDATSALGMMNLGKADPIVVYDDPAVKLSSFFGRINYDYMGRYLLSATVRADGSSKFAPGNQWGVFPSAAVAWRISDEKFMSFANNWISDFKFRASYGESGNNRIDNNAWSKTFTVSSDDLFLDGGGVNANPTAYLKPNNVLSNPKLKWETTISKNIGIDFGFFKNRLTGTVEIYDNITKDLLIKATIPSNSGYSYQWQNIGQTSNNGLEITLNGVVIEKKDFRLSLSANIAFNKSRIDKLGNTKQWEQSSNWASTSGPSGDYLIYEGGQVGLMYGYETEGMYTVDDFNYADGKYTLKQGVSDNSSLISAKRFGPGSLKLKDQNADGIVNTLDKVVIGNANPKHTGGFNMNLQYKAFDFSAFFNWVYGNNIYNANKLDFTSYIGLRTFKNLLNIMNSENRYTYINKETGAVVTDPVELTEMNKNATIWSAAMTSVPLHSWAVEDGSFLRLNNITIGYSLPKTFLSKLKISQLRTYATIYNLWTWTKYTGFDPEVDTQRATPLTPGVDYGAYPRSRSINVGLNLEF